VRNYRVYSVDGAGKIVSADWLEADDDANALVGARSRFNGLVLEVWERHRLVGRVDGAKS